MLTESANVPDTHFDRAAGVPKVNLRSSWPVYSEDEIAAVCGVLRSGRVNALQHGDNCQAFENAFAAYCGMPHAIALANGTLALELGLRALGIGPGDEVIIPARSFFASASCVIACGATPVFADVDLNSQNISIEGINAVRNERTRAIICVHLAGWPCEMDALLDICRVHNLKLIEDCAQAHGATYAGQKVGSFGDVAAFSFCTDKIISTGGEGGMLLIRDEDVFDRAWSYKDHGKSRAKVLAPSAGCSKFRWLHDSFGSNFRMTEMQAAIGLIQLRKLSQWLDVRRRNAAILTQSLRDLPLIKVADPPQHIGHAYYRYYASIDPIQLPNLHARDELAQSIASFGLTCGSGSCPEMYREKAFLRTSVRPSKRLPNARQLGRTSLMFQVDQTLSAKAMAGIGSVVRSVITNWKIERQAA
jgi:dTDP-4-amino-4,6-dideoxygalactose transaminase